MDLSLAQLSIDRAALSMYRFIDLCVAYLACTYSVNYIVRENLHKMNADFYEIKKDGITTLCKIYLSICYLYLLLYPTQASLLNSGPDI